MTPIEMRDIIDKLIKQYGFDKVNTTIRSILDFYAELSAKKER